MAGKFAHGTVFSATIGSTLTAIAELTSISGVELSADDIDATTHDSDDGYKEFNQGLKDGGAISLEGLFIADTSQEGLKDLFDNGTVVAMTIAFPEDLAEWQFNGYVNAISTAAPIDGNIDFSASVKVTGKPLLVVGS